MAPSVGSPLCCGSVPHPQATVCCAGIAELFMLMCQLSLGASACRHGGRSLKEVMVPGTTLLLRQRGKQTCRVAWEEAANIRHRGLHPSHCPYLLYPLPFPHPGQPSPASYEGSGPYGAPHGIPELDGNVCVWWSPWDAAGLPLPSRTMELFGARPRS